MYFPDKERCKERLLYYFEVEAIKGFCKKGHCTDMNVKVLTISKNQMQMDMFYCEEKISLNCISSESIHLSDKYSLLFVRLILLPVASKIVPYL